MSAPIARADGIMALTRPGCTPFSFPIELRASHASNCAIAPAGLSFRRPTFRPMGTSLWLIP
eukprot:11039230-Heterocapsa_arctica.AAC.1